MRAVGYILALGGLGVAGYVTYRWFQGREPSGPPPPPPNGDGIVKVSALTFVEPWPPQVGVPMNVMSYRPSPERGFKDRVGKYTMNIYEVPYYDYMEFPRSPRPSDGPICTFYYDKLPWEWYSSYRESVRQDVTEDMVEFSGVTPRVSGNVIVFDVGWWVRRTIWPIPIWDWYACTGYGRIG